MADERDSERVADPRADERTLRLVELAWTLWHEPSAGASNRAAHAPTRAAAAAARGAEPGDDSAPIRSVVAAIREARR